MKEVTRTFPDLGYTVIAKVSEHVVDFMGYEISATSEDGTPLYGADFVESLAGQRPYFSGLVKWDGCSNWHFDEQEHCMLHACTRDDLLNLGKVLAACRDMTAELLPSWDADVAD